MEMKYIRRLCCVLNYECYCERCLCKFCDIHKHEFCNCKEANERLVKELDLLIDKPSWAKEYENEKKEEISEEIKK